MQIIKETNLTIHEVRLVLDNIILFKNSKCLANITLVSHVNGEPRYNIEYACKTENMKVIDHVGV